MKHRVLRWVIILAVILGAVLVGWGVAQAQGCAGVTATQEDGSIKCFPPVDQYTGWADEVEYSGTGLALAHRYNPVIGSTDAICVGCLAVVISAEGRRNFDLFVVEQSVHGVADHTYYRPSLPERYDPATNISSASPVMRQRTTIALIVTGTSVPVSIEPYWETID